MLTRLLLVAGARPNFMKIAPLIRAIESRNLQARNGEKAIQYQLVHTGQHYDAAMSDIFFQQLGIPEPDVNLGVGSGSHAVQTAEVMRRFVSRVSGVSRSSRPRSTSFMTP